MREPRTASHQPREITRSATASRRQATSITALAQTPPPADASSEASSAENEGVGTQETYPDDSNRERRTQVMFARRRSLLSLFAPFRPPALPAVPPHISMLPRHSGA